MSEREPEDRQGWTDDEPPPTAEELAAAAALAGRAERLLAGDEREEAAGPEDPLLGAALVRAGLGDERLPAARRDALVGEALAAVSAAAAPRRERRIWRRYAPALALAASVLLVALSFLTLVLAPERRPAPARLPAAVLSRPSNDLLGQPIADRAAAARRLDLVFADRLAGYRRLTLGGGGR